MAVAGAYSRSPTFKSLIWRIVFLHIVAVAVVAIFLPLVLFWLLNSEIDQLHRDAMRAQAEVLGERIVAAPDGLLTFNLPDSLRGLYSEAYGRYLYDIRDADGRLLFSSRRKTGAAVQAPPLSETMSGAGVTRIIDGKIIRVTPGISRIATVSGNSTAEFVSYPGVKSIRRSETNSLLP